MKKFFAIILVCITFIIGCLLFTMKDWSGDSPEPVVPLDLSANYAFTGNGDVMPVYDIVDNAVVPVYDADFGFLRRVSYRDFPITTLASSSFPSSYPVGISQSYIVLDPSLSFVSNRYYSMDCFFSAGQNGIVTNFDNIVSLSSTVFFTLNLSAATSNGSSLFVYFTIWNEGPGPFTFPVRTFTLNINFFFWELA